LNKKVRMSCYNRKTKWFHSFTLRLTFSILLSTLTAEVSIHGKQFLFFQQAPTFCFKNADFVVKTKHMVVYERQIGWEVDAPKSHPEFAVIRASRISIFLFFYPWDRKERVTWILLQDLQSFLIFKMLTNDKLKLEQIWWLLLACTSNWSNFHTQTLSFEPNLYSRKLVDCIAVKIRITHCSGYPAHF
jgi:hypothetical protein